METRAIYLIEIHFSLSVRWIKSIASISIESNRENPICCAVIDFGVCAYETFVSLLLIWPTFAYFIANDWLNKYEKSKTRWANIRNEPRINQIKSAHIRKQHGSHRIFMHETVQKNEKASKRCGHTRLHARPMSVSASLVPMRFRWAGRPVSRVCVDCTFRGAWFLTSYIFHHCNCEWAIPGRFLCTRARCLLILFTQHTKMAIN